MQGPNQQHVRHSTNACKSRAKECFDISHALQERVRYLCMPCKTSYVLQDPFATKETYNDGPFDKFMVFYFAKKMSEQLGGEISDVAEQGRPPYSHLSASSWQPFETAAGKSYSPGYEGFVELSREIMKGRNSKQQQQAVSGVLGMLLGPLPRRYNSS